MFAVSAFGGARQGVRSVGRIVGMPTKAEFVLDNNRRLVNSETIFICDYKRLRPALGEAAHREPSLRTGRVGT